MNCPFFRQFIDSICQLLKKQAFFMYFFIHEY
ncbi:hypothetical protein P609_08860 [Comamonas thiooxydans]|nr:hypothetical protein P609_08860 [Comamonas thiooxydans]